MKIKQNKLGKRILSDKIADSLTVKPAADIEDDQVFGTKPKTVTRDDLSSSDSEVETAISDFRKHNINLLSEISKKYEGQVVSRKELEESDIESDDERPTNNKQTFSFGSEDADSVKELSTAISINNTEGITDDLDSGGESDDYSITQLKKQFHDDSEDNENEGSDDSATQKDEDDDDEDEGYDISQMDEPFKEQFEHIKKQNISDEAKKGNAVRNQLLIWESLLEMRIHLQRCMNTANQMPMPETYAELKKNNDFFEETNITKANICNMLDKLLMLQNVLLSKYPETKTTCTKRSRKQTEDISKPHDDNNEEIPSDTDNEEIPSDTEEEEETATEKKIEPISTKCSPAKRFKIGDYETEISTAHKTFKTFRDTTIQKWNEKTRLAAATNIKNIPSNTIIQQISYILSDRDKLLRRTQLKRSEYDIIGYNKETKENNEVEVLPATKNRKDDDEYIPEIFDDSDFYHQLLRELIECKSADISDPVQLSRQWIALQQMRSKMKRKVDTKATKGRKIKYVVHNQLVNYMAPEKNALWSDESKNELYSSLFGKMFEQNNVGVNANVNGFKLKD